MIKTPYIIENEKKFKDLKETLKNEGAEKNEIESLTVLINHTLEFIESNVFRISIDSDTSFEDLMYYESGTIGLYSKALISEDYVYYGLDGGFHIA